MGGIKISELDIKSKVKNLVDKAGTQQAAADIILSETGFAMSQGSISRLCKGEGKPAMFYFVAYTLENGFKKLGK
ncbi:hypothetical protein [Photobacterium damselae]|uniref:hypothetical protein n=1 Tax=Photobacterium damselae TaxID=38293 RepID=UPI001EFDC3A8|nr:hypothetical protein [Photobacterium damselae]MCG9778743.1 hypothetical protein [Photobacterium damselae]